MTTRAAWGSETRARRVTGAQGPPERLVLGGRWAVASPLRSRHGAALREAHGVPIAPAPRQRWGVPPAAAPGGAAGAGTRRLARATARGGLARRPLLQNDRW